MIDTLPFSISRISESKSKWADFLFELWNELKSNNIKDEEDIQKILSQFDMPNRIKRSFITTYKEKERKILAKIEKLKDFEINLNTINDKLIKNILNEGGKFIYKDFVGGFLLSKEAIRKIFFPDVKEEEFSDIGQIGFYLKDYSNKLGFDLIIVSDDSLIEHEYKEAFLNLFLNEKLPTYSLFNLKDINVDDRSAFNGILRDILIHLLAIGNKQGIQKDLEKYIFYVDFAIVNNPNKENILSKVKSYLVVLLSIISNLEEERILKGFLSNLSCPSKLLSYLTGGKWNFNEENNLLEEFNNITPQANDDVAQLTQSKIYQILSSNRFEVRYCTYITREIITKVEKIETTEQEKVFIKLPFTIDNPYINDVLLKYLEELKKQGEIDRYEGDLKEGEIILYRPNGLQDKIRVGEDGHFVVETTRVIKKIIEKECTYEEIRERDDFLFGLTIDKKTYLKDINHRVKETNIEQSFTKKDVERLSFEVDKIETTKKANKIFTDTMSEIGDLINQIGKNVQAISSQNEKENFNGEFGYELTFYEAAIKDAIGALNEQLKEQYNKYIGSEDINKYLFKELSGIRKVEYDGQKILLTLAFNRKYIVGSEEDDRVIIKIQIDTNTGNVTLQFDWQGMCSAHQHFDEFLAKYLQIWEIKTRRIDQRESKQAISYKQQQLKQDNKNIQ